MRAKPYSQYKSSGVEWLSDVPVHWEVKRLKTSAAYWVSNVDKVPSDEELPVRLCNYTDVYYNDEIRPDMGLMETTATADEIFRFGLRVGDVLITKDSEEWSDIAVPSLVVESAPDLVCGYHLATIRPKHDVLSARFLLRAMQASAVNQQFQMAATGVTRYGLPKSSIGEAWLPLPPPDEQRAIAAFLDRETAKIDTLVAKKQELIERLKEKRTALISRTVTRGLPPDAARAAGLEPHPKLKPSGIEWLGDVPNHWVILPLKWRARCASGDGISTEVVSALAEEDALTPVIGGNGLMGYTSRANVQQRVVVIGRVGALCGNVHEVDPPAWVTDNALILDADDRTFDSIYLAAVLRSRNLNEIAERTAQPLITGSQVRDQRLPRPPLEEQQSIVAFLKHEMSKIDKMVAKVETAIERLQEYRTALITATVTGKIDVRDQTHDNRRQPASIS